MLYPMTKWDRVLMRSNASKVRGALLDELPRFRKHHKSAELSEKYYPKDPAMVACAQLGEAELNVWSATLLRTAMGQGGLRGRRLKSS